LIAQFARGLAMPSRLLLAALLTLPTACTSVREVRDFTGDTALLIECGPDIARCRARAAEACPRGYDVLATGENQTVVQSGTPGERRTMTGAHQVRKVKCR
jgi:hypothetical protein